MTLKLPEPLPYEFVDEWIDQRLEFDTTKLANPNLILFRAIPRNPSVFHTSNNYGRHLMNVIEDWNIALYDNYKEDEEGYYNYPGGFLYEYHSKELTEEEIDELLGLEG